MLSTIGCDSFEIVLETSICKINVTSIERSRIVSNGLVGRTNGSKTCHYISHQNCLLISGETKKNRSIIFGDGTNGTWSIHLQKEKKSMFVLPHFHQNYISASVNWLHNFQMELSKPSYHLCHCGVITIHIPVYCV